MEKPITRQFADLTIGINEFYIYFYQNFVAEEDLQIQVKNSSNMYVLISE